MRLVCAMWRMCSLRGVEGEMGRVYAELPNLILGCTPSIFVLGVAEGLGLFSPCQLNLAVGAASGPGVAGLKRESPAPGRVARTSFLQHRLDSFLRQCNL
ncbi:hypothetical protein B0T25DRAFT_363435 [Lasiosphaeria hispida]|uniref:Uncharacterized protein n=1 Tax=Lasiosphaeria hispida TaxID=260671 RepID=A0AAJ0M7R6_9PEZI|nr:hypothetical protein B0T25DRAFT_363435 [Lasiosphaeria hispida]